MPNFVAGEQVELISGGAVMSVAWIEDGNALCMWHDRNKAMEKIYPVIVLRKYVPPTFGFDTIE